MKIAFLSFDFGEYSIQHANALTEYGPVMLQLPARLAEPHRSLLKKAVDYRPFDRPRLRQPIRQISLVRQLLREIRKFQPDVIHFQLGHLWFNFALPLLRHYPIVFTIHDPRHHLGDRGSKNTPQFVMDFGYRRANQIIVHGHELKRTVVDEVGIPENRVHVIPHVAIGERPSAPTADEDKNHILFFGRIWEYKGLEYLIRAEPLISRKVPDVKITIAGKGEDLKRYRRMMTNPSKFDIHNEFVSHDKRAELFQRAAVVVLPYVEATQSGIVPVSYAHSKPVVATTVGGLPECIEHGQTGLLVPPRDEQALADAIIKLLDDDVLRRRCGENGRRKLQNECSSEVVARKTFGVYQTAVANCPRKLFRAS